MVWWVENISVSPTFFGSRRLTRSLRKMRQAAGRKSTALSAMVNSSVSCSEMSA
jgi:hypothetical protein